MPLVSRHQQTATSNKTKGWCRWKWSKAAQVHKYRLFSTRSIIRRRAEKQRNMERPRGNATTTFDTAPDFSRLSIIDFYQSAACVNKRVYRFSVQISSTLLSCALLEPIRSNTIVNTIAAQAEPFRTLEKKQQKTATLHARYASPPFRTTETRSIRTDSLTP
jgi:hypothetical protein